jgi:hypothetical protein
VVVAKDHDAAEGEGCKAFGCGEATEDAEAEVAIGADEASDEAFGAEEGLGGEDEVRYEGVGGVGGVG